MNISTTLKRNLLNIGFNEERPDERDYRFKQTIIRIRNSNCYTTEVQLYTMPIQKTTLQNIKLTEDEAEQLGAAQQKLTNDEDELRRAARILSNSINNKLDESIYEAAGEALQQIPEILTFEQITNERGIYTNKSYIGPPKDTKENKPQPPKLGNRKLDL